MRRRDATAVSFRSEEHTSELQSRQYLVCRLLLEKKKKKTNKSHIPARRTQEILRASVLSDALRSGALCEVCVLSFTSVTLLYFLCFFFFNDTATTEIYTLSLHDALPIFKNGMVLNIGNQLWSVVEFQH